ncbi:MAG TPA: 3-oxoacyl-ACP reductase FabG [Solirubrobacterales bacterium]|jgi:3-oxoacyl-[acyl-carrier protein] reductase
MPESEPAVMPAMQEQVPLREGCALVTGSSRGIGAAAAAALARDGWPVRINYREDESGARDVAERIAADGGRATVVQGDVADAAEIATLLGPGEDGPVLVLVNNAGLRLDGLSPQLSDEQWQRVIDVNLTATFRATRAALPQMLRARFGRVVNVASVVGLRANAGQANYAASKAGVIGFTKTVAVEVARRGVTVNAVAPGLIETALTEEVLDGELTKAIPARRIGSAEEVAACIRFLASEQASYVTGTTLTVDGGLSA